MTERKTWALPEITIIAVNAKSSNAIHEHSFTTHPNPTGGFNFYINSPKHDKFATGIGNSLHHYLS